MIIALVVLVLAITHMFCVPALDHRSRALYSEGQGRAGAAEQPVRYGVVSNSTWMVYLSCCVAIETYIMEINYTKNNATLYVISKQIFS
jgi:hypothetical protein